MANYPSSASSDTNLYVQVNNKTTNLTANISNSDTTIPVSSTAGFPASGTVTVDLEIIAYSSLDATNFLGATRGFDGTSAVSHLSGALVSHNIIAKHHNNLKDEIIAIETDLVGINASLTPTAAADTSTSLLNRVNQIVQRFKDITGLTNWYDTFTSLPIAKGGTNSTTALTGNKAIQSDGSSIIESSVTSTELGYVSGVTSAIQTQINSKATDANVVHLTGSESIAGTKTFTDPIVQNDTSNQLVLGVTNTTTLSATAPSTSRTVTIPDLNADYSVVGTAGTQTISGTKTFDGQLIGKGTATNDSAASGYIGEIVSASTVRSAAVSLTSTVQTNIASISLTAGDWDIRAMTGYTIGGSSTQLQAGISTVSASLSGADTIAVPDSSGQVRANMQYTAGSITGDTTMVIPPSRVSLSSTTTYYLVAASTFSTSTVGAYGSIRARRVR